MKIISLKEEVRIPETDIILEAGDKIKILSQDSLKEDSRMGEKAYKVLSDLWEDERIEYVSFDGKTYSLVGLYKDVHPVMWNESIVIVFLEKRRKNTHYLSFRDISFFDDRNLSLSLVDGSEYTFK